jgi:hypothetical protein
MHSAIYVFVSSSSLSRISWYLHRSDFFRAETLCSFSSSGDVISSPIGRDVPLNILTYVWREVSTKG